MPPRAAQKRKADDGPYALSGLKRAPPGSNGTTSHAALYSTREHRDRDGFAMTAGRADWFDKYGAINTYEKDVTSHASVNPSNKRRKADPSNAANAVYYQGGMVGNPVIRGEEGPLITVDMANLPTSALLKYLQTYSLLPSIHPSPLSAQRPHPPHIALLKPPASANTAAASNRIKTPWEEMTVQTSSVKTSVKNTFGNGTMTTAATTMYSTTSTLGLSGADIETSSVEDSTAMCDVEAARDTLALIAQSHWNSMSSAFVNGYGTGGRMNERDVIDDFVVALRAKELAIRLTT